MSPAEFEQLVATELTNLDIRISLKEVFKMDFSRPDAEKHLVANPSTPFIIRSSSKPGFFSITRINANNTYENILVGPSPDDSQKLSLFYMVNEVPTPDEPFSSYVKNAWEEHQKKHPTLMNAEASVPPTASPVDIESLLKKMVMQLNLSSADIVHFDFDRIQANELLYKSPSLPFVIRRSSRPGLFVLCYRNADETRITNILIEQPSADNSEPQLIETTSEGVKTVVFPPLKDFIKQLIIENKNQLKLWQQLKSKLEQSQTEKAVISIQSIDETNVALRADELEQFDKESNGLGMVNNGHSGFAMAKALDAPYVTYRTEGYRNQANDVLKGHVVNDGLIILTGHGSPNTASISGTYTGDSQDKQSVCVERTPEEIVKQLMEAGLKTGDHTTILLSVCFSAINDQSLSHSLAAELAKQGISSTIIASDVAVPRFGYNVVTEKRLTFSSKICIAPEHVCIFTTSVDKKEEAPIITVLRPNETIQLTKEGLRFLTEHQLELQKKKDLELSQKREQEQELVIKLKSEPLIANLINAIKTMKEYGKILIQKGATDKANKITSLATQLENDVDEFLLNSAKKEPEKRDLARFKADFKKRLHSEDNLMESHREQWKPILANILLALTGIGALAIIVKVASHAIDTTLNNKSMSFHNSLFFAHTESQRLIDEVNNSVDNASVKYPRK